MLLYKSDNQGLKNAAFYNTSKNGFKKTKQKTEHILLSLLYYYISQCYDYGKSKRWGEKKKKKSTMHMN